MKISIIEAIKLALENTDEKYYILSQIVYSDSGEIIVINEKKLQEIPFAYEFYHQFRKLIDCGVVDFEPYVIQAEVSKRYQNIGRVPDFIIHVPNSPKHNLAVIQFKLASNHDQLESDFQKLLEFKKHPLKYKYLIEVVIGDEESLIKARQEINRLKSQRGEKITIIEFNVDTKKAEDFEIRYSKNS